MRQDIEPNPKDFHTIREVSKEEKKMGLSFGCLLTSQGLGNNRFKSTFSLQ